MRTRRLAPAALALVALAVPASAAAATKPTVTTGGASQVGQNTANVHGTVNPQGAATTYSFQYGTTRQYGAQTAATPAGSGTKGVKALAGLSGLAPATTYHYRLVASNAKGVTSGGDRTFRTQRQPLGVTLNPSVNPVNVNGGTSLVGVLSGTGNANRQVVLQSNPWPYTQGFMNVGNPQVTDGSGNFNFPVLSVGVNTQFKVVMPARPDVQSPIVVVGTVNRVTTHIHVKRYAHSGRVRLYGSLLPPNDGVQVLLQKFRNGQWRNIGSADARHHSGSRSTYSVSSLQRHRGQYRVYVNAQGDRVPNVGRTIRVRHAHR